MTELRAIGGPTAGHYSKAICCGDIVVTSGHLPVQPDGTHCVEQDFAAQVRLALANLRGTLEAADSHPARVIKVTAYIVGADRWQEFDRLFAQFFGEHRPARTVLPVAELHYGYLVEVEALACRA